MSVVKLQPPRFSLSGRQAALLLAGVLVVCLALPFVASAGAIWRLQWEWWLACLAGGLLCTVLGVVIGWPALRLRGPYFAIALLGLSEVGRIVAVVWEPVTRGGLGISLPPTAELLPD